MSQNTSDYTGTWLHDSAQRGQSFSHHAGEYEHAGQGTEAVKMRHAVVSQRGKDVGVWAPHDWTEQQIAEALESNW